MTTVGTRDVTGRLDLDSQSLQPAETLGLNDIGTVELRLGDGRFCVPGVQGETAGRAEGRNAIRLHSEAVGRGVTVELASLLVRRAVLGAPHAGIACEEIAGALRLRLFVADSQVRFVFELANIKIGGLRLGPGDPAGA